MAPAEGRVRIGVTQWSLDGEGPETVHRAAALGFGAIHVSSGELDGGRRLDDPRIRERYLRAAQDSGVAITAISPGDLNDLGLTSPKGSSDATRCWVSIQNAIDAATVMAVPLVFLPSFRAGEIHDERDLLRTAEVLAEACDHARGGPVTIATENTLGAAGNLELLAAAGRPELRVLLDTQNPSLWGHAVAPMVDLLWPRLAQQVHAKDGRAGQMGNASLGDGVSGFLETAEALRVHGFAGTVISENDYHGAAAAGAVRRHRGHRPGLQSVVSRRSRSPRMEPLRVGFIGAGVFSTWAIYPALHLAPIDLRAVCDTDAARARDAAARFGGGARWYTDHRRMWEEEDIEAVIAWMKPGARHELVLEALGAGYHVLVPKPPALSLDACRELAEAADRTGRTLMVHFHRRFSYGVTRAREIMSRPEFGQLTQLFCSFCSGTYDDVRGPGYDGPVHAYLCDFAVHHIDLARWLGGEVLEASVYHDTRNGGVAFAVALRFENGAVGNLQLNSQREWWRNYDRIEITGEGEHVVLDGLWGFRHHTAGANTFSDNYSDERSTELGGDGAALTEFVTAVRTGRRPIADIQDALKTMTLYQAIYDAYLADRQGPVGLPRPPGPASR